MTRLKQLLVSIAFLGLAWPGNGSAESAHRGFYAGIGPAVAFEDFSSTPLGVSLKEAWGLNAWGGYRWNEWIAAELQLENLNGFGFRLFGLDAEAQVVNFGGNAKLFPLAAVLPEQVQPFVKAGPGLTWFELEVEDETADETAFSGRLGGGIDLFLSDAWMLQIASTYIITTGDVDGLNHVDLIVGVQYQF